MQVPVAGNTHSLLQSKPRLFGAKNWACTPPPCPSTDSSAMLLTPPPHPHLLSSYALLQITCYKQLFSHLPPGPQGLEALPVTFLVFSLTPHCEKPLSPVTWWPLVAGTRVVWHLARQVPVLPEAELPSKTEGGPHEQVPSGSTGLGWAGTLLAGTWLQYCLERARNGLPWWSQGSTWHSNLIWIMESMARVTSLVSSL